MRHDPTLGDAAELAALYAAGAMAHAEREAYERHLTAGCLECRDELSALMDVVAALGAAAPEVAPRPETRERLLARVAAEGPEKQDTPASVGKTSPLSPHLSARAVAGAESEMFTLRASEGAWEETAVPGVSIRNLFVDREADQYQALVRMAPGASYPRHIHGGPEYCFVLEGDLHVDEDVLHAGDFQVAPAGSRHGVQTTNSGCLLLITSSLNDEFV